MRRRNIPFSDPGVARTVTRRPHPAALPEWVPPQLTQLVDAAPEGSPHEWAEFWENHYGRGTPSGAFIRGFMKGATEIHDEIADQL
jgi:hypothetical protein